MPVVFAQPQYPYQYGWTGARAASTQLNFRQMIEEVVKWNPEVDPMIAGRWINNYYREVIDRRRWYGLKIRGSIAIQPVVNSGSASVQFGSNQAVGSGNTGWTKQLIGLQFRVGFTYPYQTITDVDEVNQVLTLDTIYGGQTITSGGYTIVEAYVTVGGNVKYLIWAVNQQQGWPMEVNANVEMLNSWDPWRQSLGWSTVFATRAPSPAGELVLEVWPTPYGNQVFPFEAYMQPPDLEDDDSVTAPWIRSDLLVNRAIADAKLFSGRGSKYYDPTVAQMKMAQYDKSLEAMENVDNAMDQQDVTWDYGQEHGRVGFGPGSVFAQSHDS